MAKVTRQGEAQNVFSRSLCNKIRKRLGIKRIQDLSDSTIRAVIRLSNKEISSWITENSDGYKLDKMGYLATSKYRLRHMLDCKEERIDWIKKSTLSEHLKVKLLDKYEGNKLPQYILDKKTGIPIEIIHKVMWFNKRNCNLRKATIYSFEACVDLYRVMNKKVKSNKQYEEWTYADFYSFKQDIRE